MAIKGAILGDILGSTYEFGRPKDLGWVNVPLLDEKTAHFTDDTVMTLAVKKAIIEGRGFHRHNGGAWQEISRQRLW